MSGQEARSAAPVCEFDGRPMERTKAGWICRWTQEHPSDQAHKIEDRSAATTASRKDEMKDIDRAALVAELRRQAREADPKDDSFPWRQANLNLANSLERDEGWLSPAPSVRREYQAEIGRLRAEIERLRTRGGIARSLIPVAQVEKFHRRCKELGV